jgi:hypothetical protein
MRDPHFDESEMLTQAKQKAEHLVAELEKHQADLLANPPKLDAKSLAEGKQALENALASARRALKALDEAMAIHPHLARDKS